jgi:truncated hemoglobin YjbI
MTVALDKQELTDANRNKLWNYLQMAADSMVNTRTGGII